MLLKCVIILVSLLWYGVAGGAFENYVLTGYPEAARLVKSYVVPGPVGEELAQWAFIRQLHENGLDRSPCYSIPGISCGGWNGRLVEEALQQVPFSLELRKIYDTERVPMYVFEGNGAQTTSVVIIAKLFDYYVTNFTWFSEEEKSS